MRLRHNYWVLGAILVVGVLIALLVGATGGGGGSSDHLSQSAVARVASPRRTCSVFLHGTDVAIIIDAPEAEHACRVFAAHASSVQGFWSITPVLPSEDTGVVCVLTNAGDTATVTDSGDFSQGNDVCGALVHAGWSERRTE